MHYDLSAVLMAVVNISILTLLLIFFMAVLYIFSGFFGLKPKIRIKFFKILILLH